ncbi:probable TBC1 domain family member 1 at N-terminal half [Coccomyxa sp. Obi]|nr:probable TBC1 domain family member 1 at N-terminal half [Coccomyxa sp. Obi]
MDASAAVLQIFRNILTIKQEDDQLRVIDLQVGSQVHNRVPGNLRTELWLSCLHRKGVGSSYASQYQAMLHKGITAEAAYDIEKDVGRTFPGMAKYATVEGKQALERVLRAYAAFDTEVNYCQGMNFLAALLLIWLPREADAFGALVLVMKDRGLRELYKTDMTMLQARLWQLGRIMPRNLARHMEEHCAIPVLYASSWLLTAFASDFPIFFSSRVMDIILADRYLEAMMKVVVGILKACEKRLLAMTDMEKMVDFLRGEVPRWPHDKLQELLTEALAAEWTPEQAAVLEQTEGAESVVDAVQRVASKVPQVDDALEDEQAAKAPVSPAKSEPKVASFSWASKLSATSSTGSSGAQPNLLQSLTGSLSGFGASLPSYFDAAKQMTSSGLSPLGDLLGLFDSPQTAAQPGADTPGSLLGPSPTGTRQAEPSRSCPVVHTPLALGDLHDGEETQARLPEGMPQVLSTPQRSEPSTRRSLGLASSISWGPFRDSEAAEAAETRMPDGTAAMPHALAASGPAAARSGEVARSGQAARSGETARSGDMARSNSPELRWTAPRRGSESLPTSPFQHQRRQQPFGGADAARARLEDRFTAAEETRAADGEGPLSTRPEGAQASSSGSAAVGNKQPSGQHRPSRSDADSLASWGSFREPEQGSASNQALGFTGQPPDNDFLIRLSSTYSRHPSQNSDVDLDAASTAGPEEALRAEKLGQAGDAGQAPDQAQHLGQVDENGCWDGCMPGAPDLISPGEGSRAGDASEDPFRHVTLTEPQSHAQMQRGDGITKHKRGVSDWEIRQISTFAAANSGRHAPMREGSGGQVS